MKLARMITALASNEDARIARALISLGLRFEDVHGGEVSESRLAIMARILFDTCYVQEATVSPMSQDSILRTTPLKAFNQSVWMVHPLDLSFMRPASRVVGLGISPFNQNSAYFCCDVLLFVCDWFSLMSK